MEVARLSLLQGQPVPVFGRSYRLYKIQEEGGHHGEESGSKGSSEETGGKEGGSEETGEGSNKGSGEEGSEETGSEETGSKEGDEETGEGRREEEVIPTNFRPLS